MVNLNPKNMILRLKQKLTEYLLMENSIGNLSNIMTKFYVLSVSFEQIYYGIKNYKKLKFCFIICIIMWMTTFWHFLLVVSPELWSLIDNPFLPDHFKTGVFALVLGLFLGSFFKTDYLFGEINNHLDAFKLFHTLTINLKLVHRLTDKNYRRLAFLSRIMIVLALNYGATFFSFIFPLLELFLAISSQRLYCWIHLIMFTLIYINLIVSYATACCTCYIYFIYYKMRFDQLNDQIKAVIPNGKWKVIFRGKEKLLIQLINEHNSLATEIQKVNLLLSRTAAVMFITFALIKITLIYLTFYMKHTLGRLIALNGFLFFFTFGFGMSILFWLQINSTKNSFKIMHSAVCNCKMSIELRLKVN